MQAKKQKQSVASPPKLPPAAPRLSLLEADDFVRQVSTGTALKVTDIPPPASDVEGSRPDVEGSRPDVEGSRPRGLVARRRGPAVARVVAYMPTDLNDRLAIFAASNRRSVSDCINDAVRQWLK
jgi:hypothetical protein